jgi:hypothetical protein
MARCPHGFEPAPPLGVKCPEGCHGRAQSLQGNRVGQTVQGAVVTAEVGRVQWRIRLQCGHELVVSDSHLSEMRHNKKPARCPVGCERKGAD